MVLCALHLQLSVIPAALAFAPQMLPTTRAIHTQVRDNGLQDDAPKILTADFCFLGIRATRDRTGGKQQPQQRGGKGGGAWPPLRALRRIIFADFGGTVLPRRACRPLLCLVEISWRCGWQAMRMRTLRRKLTQRRWWRNTGSRRGSSPRSRTRTRVVSICGRV